MHTCVSVYVCVYEDRERISFTLVTTAAQACLSDLCMCLRARACWYYFANLSTVIVYLPVHTMTQKKHEHTRHTKNTGQYMSSNDRKSFILKEGNTIAHPHKGLTLSSTCLRKRRAAPTLFPCAEDPGNHLGRGRSLCARAAHQRSRR